MGFTGFQSLSHLWLFATPWTASCQTSLSFTLSRSLLKLMFIECCHPTISSSVAPFSSCPPSFPASRSFPMNWLLASGDQSIGASTSVLPMNNQGWFPLGLTGLILQLKGLSRVFFSTAIWRHQFFSAQPSLWFASHICTWLLEKL